MNCSKCGKEIIGVGVVINDNGESICENCYVQNINKDIEKTQTFKDENLPTDTNIEEDVNNNKNNGLNRRISIWKEKLIDLSKRNRLLNFKQTKGSTLKIIDEIPPEIFKLLYCQTKTMQFLPIKVNEDGIPDEEQLSKEELNEGIEFKSQEFESYVVEKLAHKHIDKYLQTNLPEKELDRVLRKISTTAKNTMNDLGFNVLFLTLGSVIWYERDDSDVKFEAPLLLLPIKISRKNINEPFQVEYNDDEVMLNPALLLKLKKEFGITLDDIDISDIQDSDILKIFETVQCRIKKQAKWKLLNNIYIGLFSFAKFVMYKDIDNNQDKVKNSYLVRCICGKERQEKIDINSECPVKNLDTDILPKDTYQILDADSSQQQAIAFVRKGHNLVIEGPPGTGKSQTIANIISELLAQGKKVLFVSQKIAALEVVQNRLESNGLAPFCLELHSNKTNRKQILENLVDSLNITTLMHTGSSLDILQEKRIELNDYVNAVHSPIGTINKTPYYAIGIVTKNRNIPDFEYIFDNYENWDESIYEHKKGIFTTLNNIVKILGRPRDFSWFGSHIQNLDSEYRLKLSIKENLKSFIDNLNVILSKIEELQNIICLKDVKTFFEIKDLLNVSDIIYHIPQGTFRKISFDDEELTNKINKICECIKKFNIYNNRIKAHYSLGILNEDLDFQISLFENYSRSFLNKCSINYIKHKNYLKKFFLNNYKPSCIEILSDLKNLKELRYWYEEINNINNLAENIFNELWEKENSDQEKIDVSSNSILKLNNLIKENKFNTDILLNFSEKDIDYNRIKSLYSEISELTDSIKTQYEELETIIKFDTKEAFNSSFDNIELKILYEKFNGMLIDIDNLTIWSQYLASLECIKQENLQNFYDKFIKSGLEFNYIDTAFETQFYRVWLNDFVYQKNNILREFNSEQHNIIISQFKKLDKTLIESAKFRLIQKLQTNIINAKSSYYNELSDLEHESKLQRLRKSLRQIIKMIPNLLLSIKPCLMMSPLTVSQLLDPNLFTFDYIIFDEASQLTTEDCIGSMIRGKKIVVAGDSKQLPPTSFFKTVVEPSEDINNEEEISEDEKEDLDSILDECSTSGFPKCMLKWHYRSRDEHLIAFSNKHLYKELYTFPSAVETTESMGIKWHYHEKNAQTDANARLEEAKIVAKAVLEHAKKFPNRSLGVATFNIKQKDLIEDEIATLLEKDRSCADFFSSNKKEPFFVKNLESIQGDERDVIFISIGYFKNQNGILPMKFGPLNQDGGERRLNVLVTRARYKIELYSAIRYVDFNMDNTNAKGVELLKQYLEYAERGEVALLTNTHTAQDDHFDSPFEESVCEGLRDAGLSVKTQVGCSGYKIDLAIRDEKNPGKFILGIECDGANYHSSATARDRDRLRQQVLEGLGWKFYRIWSTDWFKNPQKELDKLLKYINDLKIKNELMEDTLLKV